MSKFFRPHELACRCGHCDANGEGLHKTLLAKLDTVRKRFNRPMYVTSACRCYDWNKAVGGSVNSYHLPQNGFRAVDIACSNSRDRYLLIRYAIEAGLSVGVNKGFLHFDYRDSDPIIFTY